MITYQQYSFLCTLNCWREGLPLDEIAGIATSQGEGDPRGDVTREEMDEALQYGLDNGWVYIAPEPASGRAFAFPTSSGQKAFREGLEIYKDLNINYTR